MKARFTRIIKNCTFAAILMVTGSASAATYTAVSSGAWSNSSIWAGGVSPGSSVGTLDNVIINAGVDVTLDMDVEFTGLLTSLEVNGGLESSGDYLLDMNSGIFSGSGTLELQNLRIGSTASMTFTGDASVDNFWSEAITLNLASDTEINDTLFLDEGTFNLASGGELTFMTGSVVRIDNGAMSASSGVLNNSNDYSVMYVGTDKNTGLELAGSGLTDVWVMLDDNSQALSVTGNITIEGVLHHNNGMIDLNGGTLTLMDDYMATSGAEFMGSTTSSLSIQHNSSLSSTLRFNSSANTLNDLTINSSDNNSNVNLGSSLTINGSLNLEDGDFTTTGGTFTMGTGSEIVLTDGRMMNAGGTFTGTNLYSVTYNGSSSATSGIELTGSGLNSLTIDMEDEADSLKVMNNLTLGGALNLDNGGMAMNGNDLTLNGSLSTTSSSWFGGDEDSDLNFNNTSLIGDTLWFSSSNNEFGDITINSTDESSLMIGNDLRAENINMTTGGIQMWDNELWLNSTGTITGANEDRYVMIDGSGSLVMNVQVSAPYTMYPVGTDEGYAPVGLQQNSGTAGFFKVNSMNGVMAQGNSGLNLALTESMLDRSWDVQSVNGGSMNINMMAMWSEGLEVNSFDRNNAVIMHYTGGSWDSQSQTPGAATAVGDMFSMERENITSPGQFAVRSAALAGINENAGTVAVIYPNPVHDILNSVVSFDEPTTANVVDMTGNVLRSEIVNGAMNHTIDFSSYPEGVYFVNYTNSKGTSSYRVMKSL